VSNHPQDIGQWIQELTTRSVAEQIRSLQRYTELVQRVARGELDEQAVREEYMRFAREETTRYTRNLATLSLSYYNALIDLSRAYNERFFDQVLSGVSNDAPSERRVPPQQVALALHGPVGQELMTSFVVENKRTEAAEISFVVSEFRGPGGTAPFRPPLHLRPPRFVLGPREERQVELRLPLLSEMFVPGQEYSATVVVRGYDDLELLLSVAVEGTDEVAEVEVRPITQPEQAQSGQTAAKNSAPRKPRRKANGGTPDAG
jgi:hypothetical protein